VRTVVLAAMCCATVFAGTPKLTFTKSFPGSVPAYVCLDIERGGALTYKESTNADEQPVTAHLAESDTAALFSMAQGLGYFKMPLESGLKVANTGKKTFRYEDENGKASETTFNYSTNETAQQLLDRLEQIAESERAYSELDRTMRYDKLGVNDALANIELLWVRKQLAAPQQFIPLLTRITTHESFMHLVRDRAARLKDEFQGASSSADAEQRQK
jgi:hypothetical protein